MKHFTKLFGGLAAFLTAYGFILGGYSLGQHNYQSAVLNLVLGFFWCLIVGILTAESRLEVKLAAERKSLDRLRELLGIMEKDTETVTGQVQEIRDLIAANGGFPLTSERLPMIEAAYHEHTGKYLKLELQEGDTRISSEISSEISDEPFERPERLPEPPVAPTAVTVHIPVKDGSEPAVKPLTKSQQRRLNTKKGLGPLTDDEVREQKNAKRREARAAKKAELEQN
jgi:hypothetical protein